MVLSVNTLIASVALLLVPCLVDADIAKCTCPTEKRYCQQGAWLMDGVMPRRGVSNADRVRIMKDYPLAELYSAPAHAHIREPKKVLNIAKGLLENQVRGNLC